MDILTTEMTYKGAVRSYLKAIQISSTPTPRSHQFSVTVKRSNSFSVEETESDRFTGNLTAHSKVKHSRRVESVSPLH